MIYQRYYSGNSYLLYRRVMQFTGLLLLLSLPAAAQVNNILVDLSGVDGIELNRDNMFNYRINNQTGKSLQAEVTGRIQYRRSALRFEYKYSITLQPGLNAISRSSIPAPAWNFSDQALRELLFNYNKLPQGTYEYCVSVAVRTAGGEPSSVADPDACVYQTVNDIFLINLLDPEDDAKLYEYNPMLSWVVNYPFASELSYRIRVAELKQGQNKQNAITRNNPVYQDNHVMSTGTVYPVTARPLVKWQPYVWAVDAYYKGILLGGSEVWKFTIIEDSIYKSAGVTQSDVDISKENGSSELYAIGMLKLKFVLDEYHSDSLQLTLYNSHNEPVDYPVKQLAAVYGDNRYTLNLREGVRLKHLHQYRLNISTQHGTSYNITFKYINPEL